MSIGGEEGSCSERWIVNSQAGENSSSGLYLMASEKMRVIRQERRAKWWRETLVYS